MGAPHAWLWRHGRGPGLLTQTAASPADPHDPPIRDAASVIVLDRDARGGASVLMGQRGAAAAFMASKYVFPGGAVDPEDAAIRLSQPPDALTMSRLAAEPRAGSKATPDALAAAALRELAEETGLLMGRPGDWPDAPPDWQAYAARGLRPSGAGLRFIFRAITPPGRPRRFDARFFLADAGQIAGDAGDFSGASGELQALQWIPVAEIRRFDLPFITEVVLAEVARLAGTDGPPPGVPFFRNDDEESLFLRLNGRAPAAIDPGPAVAQ